MVERDGGDADLLEAGADGVARLGVRDVGAGVDQVEQLR